MERGKGGWGRPVDRGRGRELSEEEGTAVEEEGSKEVERGRE